MRLYFFTHAQHNSLLKYSPEYIPLTNKDANKRAILMPWASFRKCAEPMEGEAQALQGRTCVRLSKRCPGSRM